MCVTLLGQPHLEVMTTSGDHTLISSSVSVSTTTPSTDSTLSASKTESNSTMHLTFPDSKNFVHPPSNIASDFELQDHGMHPSSSATSDSLISQQEVTSLDTYDEEGEVSEQFRSTKSAFKITSVRPVNEDDLDRSLQRNPGVSTDSLRVPDKGESGESEDSILAAGEKAQISSLEDSVKVGFMVGANSLQDTEQYHARARSEVSGGGGAASRSSEDRGVPGAYARSSTATPAAIVGGSSIVVGNGTGVQPNRFRRVNQYERGRWTVRDSVVTEESEITSVPVDRSTLLQKRLSEQSSGSDTISNGTSPRPIHQHNPSEHTNTVDPTHLQPSLDIGTLHAGGIGGGAGQSGDGTSDRDSSSVHMDRSSVIAETLSLSRNTSMSSIVTQEKSVDGDEILHDSEVESVGGGGGGGVTNSIPILEQHETIYSTAITSTPMVSISSMGAVPPSSMTYMSRGEHPVVSGTKESSSSLEEVDFYRVQQAMIVLQSELTHSMTLMEEFREFRLLKAQHSHVNTELQEELRVTREELLTSKEENTRLKKELKNLRSGLNLLAQTNFDSSETPTSTEGLNISPPGRSEKPATVGALRQETHGSPPQGFT